MAAGNSDRKFIDAAFANSPDVFCEYCGRRVFQEAFAAAPARATADHRLPLIRGGGNGRSNKAVACAACNHAKGMLTEAEYRAVMGDGRAVKALVAQVMREVTPDRAPKTRQERKAAERVRDARREARLFSRLTDPKPDCPRCKGTGERRHAGRTHPCVCCIIDPIGRGGRVLE